MSEWLLFLAIVPLSCIYLTRNILVKHRFMWVGVAVGMVIAPVSFALIQMTYIPLIGKLLGLVGVLVNLTHGSIGYMSLLWSGTLEPNTAITASELVMINVFNGVLFAYIYGLIGYAVDRKLAKDAAHLPSLKTPLHAVSSH
ncbi:MAG: hypothetical protein P8X86_02215 [Desulfofustis sp.]